jgi:sugar/nucleoside kinase (ribokinase family)
VKNSSEDHHHGSPSTPERRGVIAGGNWIVDHVKLIDGWPAQDALANIVGQSQGNGGGPYNLLKNLARLGAGYPLAAVGRVGDDPDGRSILADCAAHGIDASLLRVTPGVATSYTDVMTAVDTRRRTFFHCRGANAVLCPADFDFTGTTAKYFYLGYILLLDTLDAPSPGGSPAAASVLARAREAGLRTAIDFVSASADRFSGTARPLLPLVDVLFVNDYEAEQLTGLALGRGDALDRAAVRTAARRLLDAGVREQVCLHFPEGAFIASADGGDYWQPSVRFPAGAVAGTAGAGDAFATGMLHGLHENWPLARAAELGVCAAAASLRHPTCSDSVGPIEECLALGRTHGFRT